MTPVWRSKTKASRWPFVSPSTRFVAADVNATRRPSPLIEGESLPPFAFAPASPTLTRVVVFAWRSRTKTSLTSFESPATRFVADEENATNRPSVLIAGSKLSSLASAPALSTLTRVVSPVCRSLMKTSRAPFASPETRFEASE